MWPVLGLQGKKKKHSCVFFLCPTNIYFEIYFFVETEYVSGWSRETSPVTDLSPMFVFVMPFFKIMHGILYIHNYVTVLTLKNNTVQSQTHQHKSSSDYSRHIHFSDTDKNLGAKCVLITGINTTVLSHSISQLLLEIHWPCMTPPFRKCLFGS